MTFYETSVRIFGKLFRVRYLKRESLESVGIAEVQGSMVKEECACERYVLYERWLPFHEPFRTEAF